MKAQVTVEQQRTTRHLARRTWLRRQRHRQQLSQRELSRQKRPEYQTPHSPTLNIMCPNLLRSNQFNIDCK